MWALLEMTHVHYFAFILFHTYLKIMKLVLLETNKRLRKKKREVGCECYSQNKLGCLQTKLGTFS